MGSIDTYAIYRVTGTGIHTLKYILEQEGIFYKDTGKGIQVH